MKIIWSVYIVYLCESNIVSYHCVYIELNVSQQ